MKDLRGGIIRLYEQGKTGYEIAKEMKLGSKTVYRIIKRYQETGSYNDKPRSGRPRTARTPANKRKIKGRIQRDNSNRKNSIRKMAKAVGYQSPKASNRKAIFIENFCKPKFSHEPEECTVSGIEFSNKTALHRTKQKKPKT